MDKESQARIVKRALAEAKDYLGGNMRPGTRTTFTLKKEVSLAGILLPPGRYKIEKLV